MKGITIRDTSFKLGQYTNDTFLLLDRSETSLRESLTLFGEFFLCSGLKLNYDKTIDVWLGAMKLCSTILLHSSLYFYSA